MSRSHAPARETVRAPITEPPAPAGPIHLVVDLTRCQAYAQCCFLAPATFKLHGEEALWYDPAPDEAQREQVLRAAAACPVQAIYVEATEERDPWYRERREHKEQLKEQLEESHAAQRP
ncbi:MAG TPA: ferredoxin [Ktedonobacterales bacterium]|nr:ferredoxin [Ktedonobacterales bacterium]